MHHLRRKKCRIDGYEPASGEEVCRTCGGTTWTWYCNRHGKETSCELGCDECGFRFEGETYFDAAKLAAALAGRWEAARELETSGAIARWIEHGLADSKLALHLKGLKGNHDLDSDARLLITLACLDPSGPLRWRGKALSQMNFVASGAPRKFEGADLANSILGRGVGQWLGGHAAAGWLERVEGQCRQRAQILALKGLRDLDPEKWWWLLAEPEALYSAAKKVRGQYVGSRNADLSTLFTKHALTALEALRLAAAPPEDLISAGDMWKELVHQVIEALAKWEERARRRPITQKELQAIEHEVEETLTTLHKRREELRLRDPDLNLPPAFLEAREAVRAALHESTEAHAQAVAAVERIRNLAQRGHLRLAKEEAAKINGALAQYEDLNLLFLEDEAQKCARELRRLRMLATSLAALMILVAILLKTLWK